MKFLEAKIEDLQIVQNIVWETIKYIYPKYYPEEVVEFFINHHSTENIKKDILDKKTWLLKVEDKFVGTGSLDSNNICRVFVLQQYQKEGYGSLIMDFLEEKVSLEYDKAIIDASLAAFSIYIKRGYISVANHRISVKNGRVLFYEVMEKELVKPTDKGISYNGRIFTSIENTSNGEVNGQTIFHYHQEGKIVWAEYSGGEIKRGYLIGKVLDGGKLDFVYQHINDKDMIRIGKCKSSPNILPNGRIQMKEIWQWLNGDNSCGESIIEEVEGNK